MGLESSVFLGLVLQLAAILSIRELTTAALEYSMDTAGGSMSSGISARARTSSAKPSSTALFASIQVSASIRCESLARDSPVLIS